MIHKKAHERIKEKEDEGVRCTKDVRMSYSEAAEEILKRLSTEQKIWLMSGNIDWYQLGPEKLAYSMTGENHYNVRPLLAGGIEEEGVPAMGFCDGPRGVVCGNGQSTCFPVTVMRGATFDTELEEEIGRAIGREVRAFGGNLFAGVCVNLPYHPGWGRSQETYGEESFALGAMGAALVRGVQEEDVIACVKHYAFNSMENARFRVDISCDARTEQEVFLPHFKDCVDAGAACVMTSYNRYKGVCARHNRYLLRQILKKEWGFDGFTMSDFNYGVLDTVEAANGGQDMEMLMTHFYGDNLLRAVQAGFVKEEVVDEAALRIIRTLLAFEDGHREYGESVIGCREHRELSRRCAEEGITLLKNDGMLPLDQEAVRTLAVIGPVADVDITGDLGSSRVRPAYVVTILEAVRTYRGVQVLYADGSDLEYAKEIAGKADAVVLAVGYSPSDEGEYVTTKKSENYTGSDGGDRGDRLGLHESDRILVHEISAVNSRTAVVLVGGGMIMMTEWIHEPAAVMMAYYPGQEGGTAVAEVLFGEVNPSGKLPFVVPYRTADLPKVDWFADDQYYEYYHGYTRLEKLGIEPLFPYGFGLSYTTFACSDLMASVEDGKLTAACRVKNTGTRAGSEVVQLYVGFSGSAVDRPVKQLFGFMRVTLAPGEETEAVITCPLEKLCWYNPVSRLWELEEMNYEICLGSSSDSKDLLKTELWICGGQAKGGF